MPRVKAYTGNRPLSLARIKLVPGKLSAFLGRNLLRPTDKRLYAAKKHQDAVLVRLLAF